MQWCTETMTEERPRAPDRDRLAGLDRPLRNRVTPAGELIATEHRGTMYGNRGVLHNENLALVRRYQVRRWLACVLEFRGRERPIMRPHRYTELFFLDEAVALAAGHRPCAECRHAAYQSFRTAWATARALPAKPAAGDIDRVTGVEKHKRGRVTAQIDADLFARPRFVSVELFIIEIERLFLLSVEPAMADEMEDVGLELGVPFNNLLA